MNFAILRGWCGRPKPDPDDLPGLDRQATYTERLLAAEAEKLRGQVVDVERRLEAEMKENARLVAALTRTNRYDPGAGGTPPVSVDDSVYWRAEAERHKAAAAKLDNLLAAAEGRPAQVRPPWLIAEAARS